MKSIEQFSRAGIKDIRDLKDALYLAMKLEFATIPPYLCAKWSIVHDPDRVEGVLHHIVSQEMNHLALAGNLLAAIGGRPKVCRAGFIPRYPLSELPGGIALDHRLELAPLTFDQVGVFMNVELPAFPPLAIAAPPASEGPATIGDFYDTIIRAFRDLQPRIHPRAHQIDIYPAQRVLSVDTALEVMARIKEEGEGTSVSPDQSSTEGAQHAHYYLFKEIYRQRRLVRVGDGWDFVGDRIALPRVHCFARGGKSDAQREFREALTALLRGLDTAWQGGIPLDVASMFRLNERGKMLVREGHTPQFKLNKA